MKNRLNLQAEDFSNFEDFGGMPYTGAGDSFLDFGITGLSFASHSNPDRTFSITINNGTSGVQRVQLFGNLDVMAEDASVAFVTDGVLSRNGTTVTSLSASGNPKSIKRLLAWLQHQPTILNGFQIVAPSAAGVAQIITLGFASPFRDMGTEPFNLSANATEYQFNSNMLTIPNYNRVISEQTFWFLDVVPGATTINLYFGASLNTSRALENKKNQANRNISAMGGVKVVQAAENTAPQLLTQAQLTSFARPTTAPPLPTVGQPFPGTLTPLGQNLIASLRK